MFLHNLSKVIKPVGTCFIWPSFWRHRIHANEGVVHYEIVFVYHTSCCYRILVMFCYYTILWYNEWCKYSFCFVPSSLITIFNTSCLDFFLIQNVRDVCLEDLDWSLSCSINLFLNSFTYTNNRTFFLGRMWFLVWIVFFSYLGQKFKKVFTKFLRCLSSSSTKSLPL